MINVTETYLPTLDEFTNILQEIWSSKHLTNRGQYVLKLEANIQNYLSSANKPLLVSNGTIALQIAIKALGLKGEIITTPFSYVATTSSIVWEGCKPVFVDINQEYLTIDETKIESAITKNTSAIIATHVYGNPCNVDEIEKIAEKHNLRVIYDAAHCFGVQYNGKSIFDYGDISTCSFHATKIFHTGEGGAIFCNDKILRERIFNYHNFGHKDKLTFNGMGINGKMSEINAALGLSVIKHMDEIIKNRSRVVNNYNIKIKNTRIKKIQIRENCLWNYSYYPVLFEKESELLLIEKKLNENKIYPRRYFYPSLNKLPYVEMKKMPISEELSKRILCLPIYPSLEIKDQNRIIDLIND